MSACILNKFIHIIFYKNLVNFKICKFSCHLGFCEADHQEGCKSLAVSIFRVPHPRVICFNFTQFNLYFTPSLFSFNSYVLCIRKADKCPQLDCEWLQLVRALWWQNLKGCGTKQSHRRYLKFFLQKSRFTTAFYLSFFCSWFCLCWRCRQVHLQLKIALLKEY